MSTFDRALALTLQYEGGFADHPNDPGGRTMKGVTERKFHAWLSDHGREPYDVRDITDEDLRAFYLERYWDDGYCTQLPDLLAIVHFDACVNHGDKQALKLLQRAVGTPADGMWGEMTRAAVDGCVEDRAVREYIRHRINLFVTLWMRRPDLRVFMGGWISRARHIEDAVLDREQWR